MKEDKPIFDEDVVWRSTDLMQAAVDLSAYRYTLAFSMGNLIVVVLLAGSIMMLQEVITSTVPFIIGWFFLVLTAIGIHLHVFRHVLRRVEPMKYEYQIWGITYFFIFFVGYTINAFMDDIISTQFLWFPLLGLANLIIGVTIEHFHYSKNELFARPILLYSIFLLISTPILVVLTIISPNLLDYNFITLALALILASLDASYSIVQAEKKVVRA
ncbi:MAG: hypothetical protein ACXADY_21010 [Candidatus Hodarchaeales archaeon]|jgi:hypothetical protein